MILLFELKPPIQYKALIHLIYIFTSGCIQQAIAVYLAYMIEY
jgi:hypothetical protein